MVQLSDSMIASLDAVAARRGRSRSALIRDLVADGLRDATSAEDGERIAAGYRRVPQMTPDAWGDPVTSADTATAELLARLDTEERAGGHDPW